MILQSTVHISATHGVRAALRAEPEDEAQVLAALEVFELWLSAAAEDVGLFLGARGVAATSWRIGCCPSIPRSVGHKVVLGPFGSMLVIGISGSISNQRECYQCCHAAA